MYNLTIQNDFHDEGSFHYKKAGKRHDRPVLNQDTIHFKEITNAHLDLPGMVVNFIDLGTEKILGYPFPEGEFGLLIRTHSAEAYCRYDGAGDFFLTIDKLGSYSLEAIQGSALKIKLEELTIKA